MTETMTRPGLIPCEPDNPHAAGAWLYKGFKIHSWDGPWCLKPMECDTLPDLGPSWREDWHGLGKGMTHCLSPWGVSISLGLDAVLATIDAYWQSQGL